MFSFICACDNTIALDDQWIGEWQDMWFYREITSQTAAISGFFQGCKVYNFRCTKCNALLGYYFIECPKELKDLEGKFGLKCNQSKGSLSLFQTTNSLINEVYDFVDISGVINTRVSKLEKILLQEMIIINSLQEKYNQR